MAGFGSHKKITGTHYIELVFWHHAGSIGHVVRSSMSGARNIDALFFMIMGPMWIPQNEHLDTLR
jgi:hypothetical protein